MKNILIPIDFSAFATSTVKTGVFLAQKMDAKLHLLHVVHAPEDWNKLSLKAQQDFPEVEGRMIEAQQRLDKFSRSPVFEKVPTENHIRGGAAYTQITEFAKTYKMDLIIMGVHGAGESKGQFIGSTAQRVIRLAGCPVLSVKNNFKPTTFKKILFASDFEENVSDALGTLKDLAEPLNSEINLLSVNIPQTFVDSDTMEKRMRKYIPAQKKVKFHSFIHNDYTKEEGISNFAKKRKCNLISMVTHSRKGKPNYLIGTTDTLLFKSDLPVLSFTLN